MFFESFVVFFSKTWRGCWTYQIRTRILMIFIETNGQVFNESHWISFGHGGCMVHIMQLFFWQIFIRMWYFFRCTKVGSNGLRDLQYRDVTFNKHVHYIDLNDVFCYLKSCIAWDYTFTFTKIWEHNYNILFNFKYGHNNIYRPYCYEIAIIKSIYL